MTKTLKTIQTISKVGKILSKIAFICGIVSFALCFFGLISLGLGAETLKIGGVTVHSIIEENAGLSTAAIYVSIAVAMVTVAADTVIAKLFERYFALELSDGTPFTFNGAKRLQKLGIFLIIIPLIANIIASTIYSIGLETVTDLQSMNLDYTGGIGMGLALLFVSLIFKYGAELNTQKSEAE